MVENSGMQPAAARITGLLMIADKTELTFDEIRETLNLSKSATSNALNLLLNLNRIGYITKPGDRKRYFKSDISQWKESLSAKFGEMNKINSVFREILEQRTPDTPEFNKSLEEMISLMEYVFDQIPKMLKDWEAKKQTKQ